MMCNLFSYLFIKNIGEKNSINLKGKQPFELGTLLPSFHSFEDKRSEPKIFQCSEIKIDK